MLWWGWYNIDSSGFCVGFWVVLGLVWVSDALVWILWVSGVWCCGFLVLWYCGWGVAVFVLLLRVMGRVV